MLMISRFSLLVACALFLTGVETLRAETKISARSFVIFNTKCANCHEGQCSARMCFEMDSSGAAVHIRNYAGGISGKVVEELYSVLRHMKKNCAYCAAPAKVPADGKWSKDDILLLSLVSRQGAFIPLGNLKAARYTIHLNFEEPKEFRMEILSQDFEPVVDERFFKRGKEITLSFTVEEPFKHYVRIRSKKSMIIKSMILKHDQDNH